MSVPLLLLGSGILLAALAWPLWARKIPPNRVYGFRTPLTLTNREVWYATNAIAGRDLALAGGAMMLAALPLALAARLGYAIAPDLAPLLLVAPLLAAIAHAFWSASAYVAERHPPPQIQVDAHDANREARARDQKQPRARARDREVG